ncbi:predicted protein [Histoplasma capsulatum G186AR]|uniref:Uncharacterized protein n=1 Tax=Ajellomyces capsulatus (strain G186AR / H82 / ATCC MYA-2454 / RMSCC 2432) TaxID=447093 RepID=C0NTX1_AJECG|nr:uncharacterized protein HCBG_06601 [Histoplasma capsulatum G186AR]EEH05482.1 predicted protein [Histoplasma capsulatum G186AR]
MDIQPATGSGSRMQGNCYASRGTIPPKPKVQLFMLQTRFSTFYDSYQWTLKFMYGWIAPTHHEEYSLYSNGMSDLFGSFETFWVIPVKPIWIVQKLRSRGGNSKDFLPNQQMQQGSYTTSGRTVSHVSMPLARLRDLGNGFKKIRLYLFQRYKLRWQCAFQGIQMNEQFPLNTGISKPLNKTNLQVRLSKYEAEDLPQEELSPKLVPAGEISANPGKRKRMLAKVHVPGLNVRDRGWSSHES